MSRELKFRAWDTKDKKYLGKNHPAFINAMTFEDCQGQLRIRVKDRALVFEQYTELKDIHGKEIYEGDIIEVFSTDEYLAPFEGIYRVYFDDMWLSYMAYKVKSDYSGVTEHFEPEMYDCIEVLGNIHENGDLLK